MNKESTDTAMSADATLSTFCGKCGAPWDAAHERIRGCTAPRVVPALTQTLAIAAQRAEELGATADPVVTAALDQKPDAERTRAALAKMQSAAHAAGRAHGLREALAMMGAAPRARMMLLRATINPGPRRCAHCGTMRQKPCVEGCVARLARERHERENIRKYIPDAPHEMTVDPVLLAKTGAPSPAEGREGGQTEAGKGGAK